LNSHEKLVMISAASPLLDVANLHVGCATHLSRFLEAHHPMFRFGLKEDPLILRAGHGCLRRCDRCICPDTPPTCFSDHAVLQRDNPIHVWGWLLRLKQSLLNFTADIPRYGHERGYAKHIYEAKTKIEMTGNNTTGSAGPSTKVSYPVSTQTPAISLPGVPR
jgi:hypothetical protein